MLKLAYTRGAPLRPLSISWENPDCVDLRPGHTLEQVTNKFNEYVELWLQGAIFPLLRDSLYKIQSTPTKVIGIGLGSLDRQNDSHTFLQHAAITTIATALKEKDGSNITCTPYCQDPAYTPVDKELLKSLNVTVLESPMGFLEVGSTSVVISICADVPVKQIVADDKRHWPVAMVWCRLWSVDKEMEFYQRPGSA